MLRAKFCPKQSDLATPDIMDSLDSTLWDVIRTSLKNAFGRYSSSNTSYVLRVPCSVLQKVLKSTKSFLQHRAVHARFAAMTPHFLFAPQWKAIPAKTAQQVVPLLASAGRIR